MPNARACLGGEMSPLTQTRERGPNALIHDRLSYAVVPAGGGRNVSRGEAAIGAMLGSVTAVPIVQGSWFDAS